MEGQYASISSLAVTHFPSLNHVLQWGDLSVHVLTFKLYAEKKKNSFVMSVFFSSG